MIATASNQCLEMLKLSKGLCFWWLHLLIYLFRALLCNSFPHSRCRQQSSGTDFKKDKLVQMSAKIAEYQRRSLDCVYKRVSALPKVFVSLGRMDGISALLESTCCAQQSVSKGHGVIYPTCLNHGIMNDIWIQGQSGLALATATRPFFLLLC